MIDQGQTDAIDIHVMGMRVRCIVGGPPDGRPVLFLHGIGGANEDWTNNLGHVIGLGCRVFAPDLPGHGASGAIAPGWSPVEGGAFVLALLDALGVRGPATLIGHSAGGLLALQAALAAPDRMEALVLASPGGLTREVGLALRLLSLPLLGRLGWRSFRWQARMALRVQFATQTRITDALVSIWHERWRDPERRASFLRLLRRSVGWRGLHAGLALGHRLHEVRCPVLVLWGQEDRIVPVPRGLAEMVEGLPDGRLAILTPCGHWPQIERREDFNREVAAFLARVARREAG